MYRQRDVLEIVDLAETPINPSVTDYRPPYESGEIWTSGRNPGDLGTRWENTTIVIGANRFCSHKWVKKATEGELDGV